MSLSTQSNVFVICHVFQDNSPVLFSPSILHTPRPRIKLDVISWLNNIQKRSTRVPSDPRNGRKIAFVACVPSLFSRLWNHISVLRPNCLLVNATDLDPQSRKSGQSDGARWHKTMSGRFHIWAVTPVLTEWQSSYNWPSCIPLLCSNLPGDPQPTARCPSATYHMTFKGK